jgi:prepilin-type N-terminal cleavage/methylation domain-containing protein
MIIRKQKGFTLVEMLVVIAIIAILAAALFPAIQSAMDQARAAAMKSKGRGVWLAIMSANKEREPLEKGALWPAEAKVEFATITTAPLYFDKLMGDAGTVTRPEDQLASDLRPEMLSASGFPPAANGAAPLTANIAWHVAEVSDSFASADAFLISKDLALSGTTSGATTNTAVDLSTTGPFKGRRILWVTRGGGVFDAKKKYVSTWEAFYKLTNSVPFLGQ